MIIEKLKKGTGPKVDDLSPYIRRESISTSCFDFLAHIYTNKLISAKDCKQSVLLNGVSPCVAVFYKMLPCAFVKHNFIMKVFQSLSTKSLQWPTDRRLEKISPRNSYQDQNLYHSFNLKFPILNCHIISKHTLKIFKV